MERPSLTLIIVEVSIVVILLVTVLSPIVRDMGDSPQSDDEYYVFMITGQSNSAYRLADLSITNSEVERIPYNTAFYLGSSERPAPSNPTGWESMIDGWTLHSMNNEDGSWHVGNYEAELASIFYHATDKKCVIINAGWDSASINASQPGGYENEYVKAMFDRAVSLIPRGADVKLGCIFWSQGEADDDMAVEEYKSKFLTMWGDYKSSMGWEYINMAQTRFDQSPITPEAQEELDGIDGIHLATTVTQSFSVANGLLNSDNQHYSQKGRIVVAQDWMHYYLDDEYAPDFQDDYRDEVTAIASIIPILVAIGIVLGLVGMLFLRRE